MNKPEQERQFVCKCKMETFV